VYMLRTRFTTYSELLGNSRHKFEMGSLVHCLVRFAKNTIWFTLP